MVAVLLYCLVKNTELSYANRKKWKWKKFRECVNYIIMQNLDTFFSQLDLVTLAESSKLWIIDPGWELIWVRRRLKFGPKCLSVTINLDLDKAF